MSRIDFNKILHMRVEFLSPRGLILNPHTDGIPILYSAVIAWDWYGMFEFWATRSLHYTVEETFDIQKARLSDGVLLYPPMERESVEELCTSLKLKYVVRIDESQFSDDFYSDFALEE